MELGLVIQATPDEITLQFSYPISNPNWDKEEGKEICRQVGKHTLDQRYQPPFEK
jgi:hypothetical protein